MESGSDYPPNEFCRKYGRVLAPRGTLVTPTVAFSRYTGPDAQAQQKTHKALKVTLKRIEKQFRSCVVCGSSSDTTFGQLTGDCISCQVTCCSADCVKHVSTNHSELCPALATQRVDQFVECLPVPVDIFSLLDVKGGCGVDPDTSALSWTHWFSAQRALIRATDQSAPPIVITWAKLVASAPYFYRDLSADHVRRSLRRLVTGLVTLPLTIAHAIRQFGLVKRSVCRVHMVGADMPEVYMAYNGLCRLIAPAGDCQRVQLTLISPDQGVRNMSAGAPPQKPLLAGSCSVAAWAGFYHDFHRVYVKDAGVDDSSRPHLVVCIHPGAHADELYTTWRPTLQLFIEHGYPVAMTTYNRQEFEGTVEKLDDLKAHYLYKGKNPLASQHVKQTPKDKTLIWSNNAYLILFKGPRAGN